MMIDRQTEKKRERERERESKIHLLFHDAQEIAEEEKSTRQ